MKKKGNLKNKTTSKGNASSAKATSIQRRKTSSQHILLGLSGDRGSFSEEAALLYAQRHDLKAKLVYCIDMEGVLAALEKDEIDLGIFPVVNSRGGLVHPAFKAMGSHLFNFIDEIWMEIYQCLLVKPGVKKEEITAISSHSQALDQCERYLRQQFPQARLQEWRDTAKAAKDLSEGVLPPSTAVIAPLRSANIYHLRILAKGIQDSHPNLTTFIITTNLRGVNG